MDEFDCMYCRHFDEVEDKYPCNKCANSGGFLVPGAPMLWESVPEESETVNHPSHYNQGGIECIDAMLAAFGTEAVENFCLVNAFKYVWRTKDKNGLEDVEKAIWYLNKYKELVSNG